MLRPHPPRPSNPSGTSPSDCRYTCSRSASNAVPATVDKIEFQTVHPRPGQEEIKPVMYFVGKQKGLILTSTNQDFLRATFGDEITASYGKPVTLRAVHKIIAGRGCDTVIIGQTIGQTFGQPAQGETSAPAHLPAQEGKLP